MVCVFVLTEADRSHRPSLPFVQIRRDRVTRQQHVRPGERVLADGVLESNPSIPAALAGPQAHPLELVPRSLFSERRHDATSFFSTVPLCCPTMCISRAAARLPVEARSTQPGGDDLVSFQPSSDVCTKLHMLYRGFPAAMCPIYHEHGMNMAVGVAALAAKRKAHCKVYTTIACAYGVTTLVKYTSPYPPPPADETQSPYPYMRQGT